MQTSIVRHDTPECVAIDATIFGPAGQSATAGGGYVSRDLVYAYVDTDSAAFGRARQQQRNSGQLTLWDGTVIGRWHTVSRYRRYGTQLGYYTMHCIVATIAYGPARGTYHGRYNEDWSQLVTLRPSKTA